MFLAGDTALNRCQLAFLAQLGPGLTLKEGRSAPGCELRWRDLVTVRHSIRRYGFVYIVGVVSGQGLRGTFEAFIVTKVCELGGWVEGMLMELGGRVVGVLALIGRVVGVLI